VRVIGASLWRTSDSVLVLTRGAAETESERATFFFKAGFSVFSEVGGGLADAVRFGRLVFCVSASGGMKGGLWPLDGNPPSWGNACFSLNQGSVWEGLKGT